MSLYDKYNINPYIKTYVGAPVQEFQNTAGQLQNKYYDTIDRSNVMKQGLSKLSSMSGDKAYLEQLKAKYEGDIEQMLESPELANRAVRTLAGEFIADKDLQLIAKNKAAFDKTEKDLVDMKASHIQRTKFQDAIDKYNASGGASRGLGFSGPSVYEEQDLMKGFDELVKGIKGLESGVADVIVGADGSQYIQTNNQEKIPVSKIRTTALGLLNDPKIQRQLTDESNYHNKVSGVPLLEDGSYDKTHENYRSPQDVADGYIRSVEAKYYSVSDSSKLTGPKKGTGPSRKGTLTGGDFAGSIVQFDAEDEIRSNTWGIDPTTEPQEVVNQYNTARNNIAAAESGNVPENYTMAMYSRDQALITGHNNAYKTSIINSDLKDSPAAQEAVQNIPAPELFNMNNRPIDKEEVAQGLDNVVTSMNIDPTTLFYTNNEFGNPNQRKMLNSINEQYGPEVAGALASELYGVELAKYNPEGMYPGFNRIYNELLRDPATRERMQTEEGKEEVFAERFAEVLENVKETVSNFPDEVVDTTYGQERAKELLRQYNPGISEDLVNSFAKQLNKVSTADKVGTTDYLNALEDGANDYGVDRQQVTPEGILSEDTDTGIKGVLQTVINNYAETDEAPLDMIQILEEGKVRNLSSSDQLKDIANDYQLTADKIKIIGIDSQHGNGMIQLQLTPKATGKDSPGPKNISINVDALSPDIRQLIAADAMYQYRTRTSQQDREKAFMVYSSFGMPEIKEDLNAMFIENQKPGNEMFDTDRLSRSPEFSQRIRNAYGNSLVPVVTAGNKFNFKRSDGQLIFIQGAASSDTALRMLFESIESTEQRILGGNIGTPISQPDSPDDTSNNTVTGVQAMSTLQGMPEDNQI